MSSKLPKKFKIIYLLILRPLAVFSVSLTYHKEYERSCDGDHPKGMYFLFKIVNSDILCLRAFLVMYF